MLTKPSHQKALDPVIVGVVFKSVISGKTFIRIKKLTYKINYLTQFFEPDAETGFFVDKFTNN